MSPQPPRLAVALLDRFLPGEEALAGDLIEEFEARPSPAWFWRQTLGAIVIGAFRQPDATRPLRLLDREPSSAARAGRPATTVSTRRVVNLTASPIAGVGGLSLGVLLVLMTIVAPGAWWAIAASVVLGAALAAVLIAINRTRIG